MSRSVHAHVCESVRRDRNRFLSRSGRCFSFDRVGSGLVGVLVTGDCTESTMAVPPKRNHQRWSGEPGGSGTAGLRGGLIRRPGRRRAPLRRTASQRLREVSVRCVALPPWHVVRSMSATRPWRQRRVRPVTARRIEFVRLTSPISSCVEPHQDTHQKAHQKSVSAGHSVARLSASKPRACGARWNFSLSSRPAFRRARGVTHAP